MRKLFITIMLLAVYTVGWAEQASGTCGDNLTWSLSDDGVLTISGSGDMYDYGNSWTGSNWLTSAPWGTYEISSVEVGDMVTSIGQYAFCGCTSLISIGDLSACTNIRYGAFQYCSSLTSIGDLTACANIGENAFESCSSLKSIRDLSMCTNIENCAFIQCI